MSGKLWVINGNLVLPDRVVKGHIEVDDGIIAGIHPERRVPRDLENAEIVDAEGMFVLPGLIDIHGDAIEKEVQPRPNTLFPLDTAFFELEKKLAASGITTMYHSLSLGVGLSLRGVDVLLRMLEFITARRTNRSMVRHRIHLRYEILYQSLMDIAERLIADGIVDYFSYMLHAPGQGQYKRAGAFEAYVMKNQGVDREEVKEIVEDIERLVGEIDWQRLTQLIAFARAKGISVASHDDDSIDKVDRAIGLGASVVEFPLNVETAVYAASNDVFVCVGAPNIVRGQSHDRNMSALDAVKAEAADVLCSDYYPPSMLQAVFRLVQEGVSLHAAANMASLNPAQAVGIDRRLGSIEPSKFADLLLVEDKAGYPDLRRTIVQGVSVYQANYYCPE